MKFSCIETATNSNLVIQLHGDMDATGCSEIRSTLQGIINTHSKREAIALDLSHVTFLDSSGIGVIVFLYKRLKSQNCSLEIINTHGQPLEFIKLLRIDSTIPVNAATTHELSREAS